MNQAELINALSAASGLTKKDTEGVLKKLGDVVASELFEGGEVTLPGLGKLSVKATAARKGRNPATGAEMDIPAKNVPKFTAAKALKDAVNG